MTYFMKLSMFKWKHYVKLLYRESKSTCSYSLPKDDSGRYMQHYVEFLEQVVNGYSYCEQVLEHIDGYNCLQYKNIKFYVYCKDVSEYKMCIELVDGEDSLFVFENGMWLHEGIWCKQIKNILESVDKR